MEKGKQKYVIHTYKGMAFEQDEKRAVKSISDIVGFEIPSREFIINLENCHPARDHTDYYIRSIEAIISINKRKRKVRRTPGAIVLTDIGDMLTLEKNSTKAKKLIAAINAYGVEYGKGDKEKQIPIYLNLRKNQNLVVFDL